MQQGRVLVFTALGEYVGYFDAAGLDGSQLGLPVGIAIDSEDRIYVVDTINGRVIRYAPLVTEEPTPTPTPTPTATETPTSTPTATPTATATATPTSTPTAEGAVEATPETTTEATSEPTATATVTPTPTSN